MNLATLGLRHLLHVRLLVVVVTEVYVRHGDPWKLDSLSFTRLLGQ